MKKYYKDIIAVFIILIIGIILQKNYINEFPSHIHAWAQSDRYALALRFADNNLNFFKPETFVYNHQFPNDMKVPAAESITAVDFPVHDYIPAIFMKLSNNKSPWIFRLYILLYSFIGLFFLFRLSQLLINDILKSAFIILFAATSPVYVYYQSGFLPTIPSLSNAIIGIYFFTLHLKSQKNKHFNLSILFVTLAVLSRTTFAIPLIAIFGFEFIRILQRKTKIKSKIVPVLISVSVILIYFFYNNYLRKEYGSIFLNNLMPATSFQQIVEIIQTVKERWGTQYFSKIHYVIIASLLGIFVITFILKRSKKSQLMLNTFLLTVIILIGNIAFALLMFRQFSAHDYYFLDTFFLPLILLIILILSTFPIIKGKLVKGIISVIILTLGILLVSNARDTQKSRRVVSPWDRTTATINNYTNSEKFLDSLKIPENAKILVIDAYAPNIPFILMNRKGYAVMVINKKNIISSLSWDYDYIVMQKEFFLAEIYSCYPEIITKTNKIWDNGKLLICKLNDDETHQELFEFIGLDKIPTIKDELIDFESIPNNNWRNIKTSSEQFHSGNYAGVLTDKDEFGITYSTSVLPELKEKERLLYFQSFFLQIDTISDVKIVVTISEDEIVKYYETANLQDMLSETGKWENISLMFHLPMVTSDNYEFSLYLWNIEKSSLFLDDFEFKIY